MANTLYEYFLSQGKTLPTISERSQLFQQLGLGNAGTYSGTAEQNNRMLSSLQNQPSGSLTGTTPSTTSQQNPYQGVASPTTVNKTLSQPNYIDQVTSPTTPDNPSALDITQIGSGTEEGGSDVSNTDTTQPTPPDTSGGLIQHPTTEPSTPTVTPEVTKPTQQYSPYNFAQAIDAMRTKLATSQDLIDTRNKIYTYLYDRPLTDVEKGALTPSVRDAMESGDRNRIDFEVRLINDQIKGRTDTLDTSIKYLTDAYQKEIDNTAKQKDDAISNVLKFVTAYGSNAGQAMRSLYGEEYVKQLKDMGIDIEGFGSINTLSENKTQAQYGQGSISGYDVVIPRTSRLATVNNNPFNLRYIGQAGATQGESGFAKFATAEEGWAAGVADIQYKMDGNSKNLIPDGPNAGQKLTPDSSLEDMIRIYAPTKDNNNPVKYAQTIASALGVTPQTKLSQLDAEKVAVEMAKVESGATATPIQSDLAINAQMLVEGTPPSVFAKRGKEYNQMIALARRIDPSYDPAKAQIQYEAAKRFATSLNSPQMVTFGRLAKAVVNTIDEVRNLASKVKLSGIVPLNYAKLQAYVQLNGNTEKGQLISQYLAAVNTLKAEFAGLETGGYAPTESSWDLANKQINENYGVDQLNASLTEIQRLINFRVNAAQEIPVTYPQGYAPSSNNNSVNNNTDTSTFDNLYSQYGG